METRKEIKRQLAELTKVFESRPAQEKDRVLILKPDTPIEVIEYLIKNEDCDSLK